MHPDPTQWSVQEVKDFFEHEAPLLSPDFAEEFRASINEWSAAITKNKLNGHRLLRYMSFDFISRQNLADGAIDMGVIECVEHLRERSRAAQETKHSIATPPHIDYPSSTVIPSTERPESTTSTKRQASAALFEPAQDKSTDPHTSAPPAKKRRVAILQTIPKPAVIVRSGYMASQKLTVNDIFYGDTKLDGEIEYAAPSTTVTTPSIIVTDDHENMLLISGRTSQAETRFAWKRMKHFMMHQDPVELRRSGSDVAYVLPYRPSASAAPSATVFRRLENGKYTAVRQNVMETPKEIRLVVDDQHNVQDEHTHLLIKYAGAEDEEPLPLLTASDDEYSMTSDGGEELLSTDDEMAEEGDDEIEMSDDEKQAVLAEAEHNIQLHWKENKLPKLEAQTAQKIWNKMRNSRSVRQILTEGAFARKIQLEARLVKLRAGLMSTVKDKDELVAAASMLEPTIEDMLMEQWKMEVWSRKHKPEGQSNAGSKQHNGARAPYKEPSHALPLPLPLPFNSEDRICDLPHPPPTSETVAMDEDVPNPMLIPSEAQQTSHTQDAVSDGSDDFVIVDDPMSDHEHELHELRSSPPPTPQSLRKRHEEDLIDTAQKIDGEASLANETSTRLQDDPNADSDSVDDDMYDFPDISTFVKPVVKTVPEPVELSSDSSAVEGKDTQLCKKRPVSKKITTSSKNVINSKKISKSSKNVINPHAIPAEDLTSEQIDQLDPEKLTADKDRRKILIKLLHDQEPAFRDDLHKRSSPAAKFSKALGTALHSIADKTAEDHDAVMISCAGLCLAWYYAQPSIFHEQLQPKAVLPLLDDPDQTDLFISQLQNLLLKKASRMFNRSTAANKGAVSTQPWNLSSSDDSDDNADSITPANVLTKRKKKDNKLKREAIGTKNRIAAHERAEQYTQKQNSQLATSSQAVKDGAAPLVEVNPVRADDQPAIHIHEHIARSIKPHQIDGVRFLWRELTALSDEKVNGCLLAHTMGLGKTMQTITILTAIAQAAQSSDQDVYEQLPGHLLLDDSQTKHRILILCPPSLLNNWGRELYQWDVKRILGEIFRLDNCKDHQRVHQLNAWRDYGGVLLVGYETFRNLVQMKTFNGKVHTSAELAQAEHIRKLLLKSGDIAVLDEAQYIKSHTSETSQTVAEIEAKVRIALTGTPLSNSIDEIYAIINWISPAYLGSRREFNRTFAKPIKDGLYRDSPVSARRKAIKKLKVLRAEIGPKYQRATISVLKGAVPTKVEFTLTVALSETQAAAYRRLISVLKLVMQKQDVSKVNLFAWLHTMSLLAAHTEIFRKKLLEPQPPKGKSPAPELLQPINTSTAAGTDGTLVLADELQDLDLETYAHGFTEDDVRTILGDIVESLDPTLSAKTQILMDIVKLTARAGEKMLVFSMALPTLDYLQELFRAEEIRYDRIDGKVNTNERTERIKQFSEGPATVLLISTKAGGMGLNIQCANRAVIFDSGFNPTYEQQAVGRIYRIGQTKPTFVYRILTGGTFETNLENMQIHKMSMADRVVDQKDYQPQARKLSTDWLYDPMEVLQTHIRDWIGKDEKVLDVILEKQLASEVPPQISHIYAIKTTETLQVDADDEVLNPEEEKEVELEIDFIQIQRRSLRLAARSVQPSATAGASNAARPSSTANA